MACCTRNNRYAIALIFAILTLVAMGAGLCIVQYNTPGQFGGSWLWYLSVSAMACAAMLVVLLVFALFGCTGDYEFPDTVFDIAFTVLKLELFALSAIIVYTHQELTVPIWHKQFARPAAIVALSAIILFDVYENVSFSVRRLNVIRAAKQNPKLLNNYLDNKRADLTAGGIYVTQLASPGPGLDFERHAAAELIRQLQLKYPDSPHPYR